MPLFIIIVSIYLFRLYTVITDRYVVFFIIFFINYGSALTWSLVTVRYEAAHSRLAKKRFTLREKKKGRVRWSYYKYTYYIFRCVWKWILITMEAAYLCSSTRHCSSIAIVLMILPSLFVGVGSKQGASSTSFNMKTHLHTLVIIYRTITQLEVEGDFYVRGKIGDAQRENIFRGWRKQTRRKKRKRKIDQIVENKIIDKVKM